MPRSTSVHCSVFYAASLEVTVKRKETSFGGLFFVFSLISVRHALPLHRVCHFEEACDVGAHDEVTGLTVLRGSVVSRFVNALHDVVELLVHFFERPGQTRGVLAHLETAGRDAAGVCRFRGTEGDARLLEGLDSFGGGRHVRALCDVFAAVLDEQLRALFIQLVLRSAGESDVALDGPYAVAALVILGALYSLGILLDALSLHFLYLLYDGEVDAVLIVHIAVGVGKSDDFRAELLSLFRSVDRDVAGTGDDDSLTLEVGARALEHFLHEVAEAVAGSFRSRERAAVGKTFAREHAGEFVAQSLVLTEHETDLARAYADVARGHVGVRADVLGELGHERLAEAHDLVIALALGVEVAAALAAAHGKGGEAVFEYLLETEELDDGSRHGRVESETALVRSDRGVELYSESAVDLHLAFIVHPAYSELDKSLGLDDPVEYACFHEVGALCRDGLERLKHLSHSLLEFGLVGVSFAYRFVHRRDILVLEHVYFLRNK